MGNLHEIFRVVIALKIFYEWLLSDYDYFQTNNNLPDSYKD